MSSGPLIGRRREQAAVAKLVANARAGHGGALVVSGEAGIGKTALLDDIVARSGDIRIIRISGAESELELAFGSLQQLCAPLHQFMERLSEPQHNALRVALGIRGGDPPDALLVGLALLGLLGEAAGDQTTMCIIDDAQWLDSASLHMLTIAARRIVADPVAMIFATRDTSTVRELAGLPELTLRGLGAADARALLAATLPGRLDEQVLANIISEATGNPLALLEIPKALSQNELAGGYGIAQAAPPASVVERSFLRQIRGIPAPTRTLLVLAACEPTGRSDWLWAAAAKLGVAPDAVTPAQAAELVNDHNGIRFRHPLIRTAIYRSASLAERRRAHGALAEVITEESSADHRAWHHAHAAAGPDADVADALELSAERARARGGIAASAAFIERAAHLSVDVDLRARRALSAAQAKLEAGSIEAADHLLAVATDSSDDESIGATAELLRARLTFATRRGNDAPPLLLAAAQRLSKTNAPLSRETFLEALTAAALVGRFASDPHNTASRIAQVAHRDAPPEPHSPHAIDDLLSGLILRLRDGHAAAAPRLRSAVTKFLQEDAAGTAEPRWHEIAYMVCLDLFDQDSYNHLVSRQTRALRATGALSVMPPALVTEAGMSVTAGKFVRAEMLLGEAATIVTATTGGAMPDTPIHCYLAAYRGQEDQCREHVEHKLREAQDVGQGFESATALYALAILHIGLGQFQDALTAASRGVDYDELGICGYLLAELVEAASRCGDSTAAREALARLTARTDASPTGTAKGIGARSAALVCTDDDADALYREALAQLQRSPAVVYLARTHLVYGEWLRRVKRRSEARTQLRTAYDLFTHMGADGFARRARRELTATGEKVITHTPRAATGLTTQETQIAALVRDGYTNAEIAGQLFLSPRTVEWHLGHIFTKLGVASRRSLRGLTLR
ncbi:helix-turn-helix transcriptional regulator [Mycobacterium stomatepiae]|uniref:helix-turn-helix transcriptional regulator n=1 Tax=Mycobacterium stomatepiae TaxID=470076 RepID=UPI0013D1C95B|nr:LuxR family transcriptional regulator [Mycobacterium stomatepiae]MCV7168237.1 AAA family ATPase [Mycobacterium stomatepiae]